MKPNTHIRLLDGRDATVVWHWLNGYGIVWGLDTFPEDDLPQPVALLREPHRSRTFPGIECVGTEYEVIDLEPAKESDHA